MSADASLLRVGPIVEARANARTCALHRRLRHRGRHHRHGRRHSRFVHHRRHRRSHRRFVLRGRRRRVLSSAFAVLVLGPRPSSRSSCPRNVVLSFHALSFHYWAAPAAARRGQAGARWAGSGACPERWTGSGAQVRARKAQHGPRGRKGWREREGARSEDARGDVRERGCARRMRAREHAGARAC